MSFQFRVERNLLFLTLGQCADSADLLTRFDKLNWSAYECLNPACHHAYPSKRVILTHFRPWSIKLRTRCCRTCQLGLGKEGRHACKFSVGLSLNGKDDCIEQKLTINRTTPSLEQTRKWLFFDDLSKTINRTTINWPRSVLCLETNFNSVKGIATQSTNCSASPT